MIVVLHYFKVANWGCFRDEVVLDMQATNERGHKETLTHYRKNNWLPLALIFGANGSGKTTLVRAFDALKTLVAYPEKRVRHTPHEYADTSGAASLFEVEFSTPVGGVMKTFRYHLEWDGSVIVAEQLDLILSDGKERPQFVRSPQLGVVIHVHATDKIVLAHSTVVADGKALLGELGGDKRAPEVFRAAYTWFAQSLQIITPETWYVPLLEHIDTDELLREAMSAQLATADTGIEELYLEEVSPERLPFSEIDLIEVEDKVRDGERILAMSDRDRYLFTWEGGCLVGKRLCAQHDGGVTFSIADESDGTRRFLELLPMLFDLSARDESRVYVVDEVEHSMHPSLTKAIIRAYLEERPQDSRSQLIATTHETELLDERLVRRDELWFTEKKDARGRESELVSFSEFAPRDLRKGKSLRKVYLDGRLGGVPCVG
ncbi:AAA family ATPase [Actinotignum schaalii]|uniref:AAA family ATPase n=1 Tax=Actinotignum TaxID=1653174 RepID=UPI0011DCF882|nr:ATP-binding protein [Actinotignum schaalii]WQN44880.1 AAA family ATPase [Actinotignum schaalii]